MREKSMIAASSAAIGILAVSLAARAGQHCGLKRVLGPNMKILNRREKSIACALLQQGHRHLLTSWPPPGMKDEQKHRLLETAATVLSSEVETARLEVLPPPKAKKERHEVKAPHGKTRVDDYYWLRDDERKSKEVLDYLKAENEYTKAVMADTKELQEKLFKELRGRIKEDDNSVPERRGSYLYYTKTLEGEQYSEFCRQALPAGNNQASEKDAVDPSLPKEILLDMNAEAKKSSFYMVGDMRVSPNASRLAYAEDRVGNETYSLYVKDLQTGQQLLKKPIKNVEGLVVWAADSNTIFYVTKDAALRPEKVWRHKIGTDPADDVLVYHETDDSFNVGVDLSRDEKYLYIQSSAAVTSEVMYLDATTPEGDFKVILPRVNDFEYEVEHRDGTFFMIVRDKKRPNSELVAAPVSKPSDQKVLISHRDDVKLEEMSLSKDFLAVAARKNALKSATVFKLPKNAVPESLSSLESSEVNFNEPAYSLSLTQDGEFDSPILRLIYDSLTTPVTTIDLNMQTGNRVVKKVTPVLGGFDSKNYKTEREWATAGDGTKVPISIVYRHDLVKLDGSDPMLLEAYGSYGYPYNARFERNSLSLLDRGFVMAIAHVRGGGDMGRLWYEDGKFKHKKNTFTDFIAAAEHLINKKYTNKSRLCIQGRSAGGLTMGAVLNMRPDLFSAVILGVPFVDVVTTMLDETIPLTTGEYEEWGNPAQEDYYDYMLSYSPVDNIKNASYPNILTLAGLHDPRVAYWEPAKYVAKLREHKLNNDTLLLLKCDLGAGHFSQSGRFDALKEVALEQAFLLKTQNMLHVSPSS